MEQLRGQSLDNLSFGTDSTLEFVTWNIRVFPQVGSPTVDSVKKIIERMDVDVLCLQEINDSTACRQMMNDLPRYTLFMDNIWFGGLVYIYKTSSITATSIYKIYDTSPY